ncbi:hypothetical protein OS242_18955 [Tumebacillus sp. DT12]|uniref:Cytochrome oxidase subunit II copper A binding domain-containing protein n=1 Tax=Tumebacillus lacus TaxID=2995335 RepID=A0ABT3X555_9BACL|nr:hypothetical protein [Tumebacillus lacus]MCX7572019.1 hypothetical protein [Tumebacillus lacus]
MKKSFALLTATAVAVGMIVTGCGSDKEATTDKATETTSSNTNTNSGSTSTSTDKAKTETPAATGTEQVVKLTALKDFKWELDKTEVKVGQPVKLVVSAAEGAGMHGVTIPGTSVKNVHAMAGKEETVTFTPDKAGDLTLECSLACGTGHMKMKTTLKVVE